MHFLLFTTTDFEAVDGEVLPFENKKDMKLFMALTIGKTLVMDEKTYIELKSRHPRLKRECLVISNTNSSDENDLEGLVCKSYAELKEKLMQYDLPDVTVVGGSDETNKLTAYCSNATVVETDFLKEPNKDVYNFNHSTRWVRYRYLNNKNEQIRNSKVHRYFNTNIISPCFMYVIDQFIKEDIENEKQASYRDFKQRLLSKKMTTKSALKQTKSGADFKHSCSTCTLKNTTDKKTESTKQKTKSCNIDYEKIMSRVR